MKHSASSEFVLPRPGAALPSPHQPIPGPSEEAFTSRFGTLLPPAQYLHTSNGKAAYYSIPPATSETSTSTPNRVLFLHGVQTPALGMQPLAAALHSKFPHAHLVLIDLWGHGLSDTPILPHDASLFHGLLDALLDHLQWPTTHIVGFSFGSSLTVGYAATRPERVKSFTLVAPAGLIRSDLFTPVEQVHFLRGCNEHAARKFIIGWLEGGDLVVPADCTERAGRGEVVAEALRKWQMREHAGHAASVVAVFRDGGAMDNFDAFTRAISTRIPSIVILGANDEICSEKELREIGFKDVFVVPQAGHGIVREKVPEVAGFITAFWTKLDNETRSDVHTDR
jgi:pimeloyl-ACP methyl ester carboxylesterase